MKITASQGGLVFREHLGKGSLGDTKIELSLSVGNSSPIVMVEKGNGDQVFVHFPWPELVDIAVDAADRITEEGAITLETDIDLKIVEEDDEQ